MVGAADSDKCRSVVESIFDFKTCSSPQCSFNGVEQPPVTGDFMVRLWGGGGIHGGRCSITYCNTLDFCRPRQAYAGFYFTASVLRLNGTSDLDQFNSSLRKFCHTHWGEVGHEQRKEARCLESPLVLKLFWLHSLLFQVKKENKAISDKFLRTYCYASNYVFTLLTDGYKFDKETWKNINFKKEVSQRCRRHLTLTDRSNLPAAARA